MEATWSDNFKKLPAQVLLIENKKRVFEAMVDEEGEAPKRSRTTLGKLGQDFIDTYLPTYSSLSGDAKGRKRLYKEILSQAITRKDTLGSEKWTEKIIKKRLATKLNMFNLGTP